MEPSWSVEQVNVLESPSKCLYLHALSNHPRHVFIEILEGELMLYLRNTTSKKIWLENILFLFIELFELRYTAYYLRQTIKNIKFRL